MLKTINLLTLCFALTLFGWAAVSLPLVNLAVAQCLPEEPCDPEETPTPTPTPTITPTPPPTCSAGGPYADIPCSGSTSNIPLNGSAVLPPPSSNYTVQWGSDCPTHSFSDVQIFTPNLSFSSQNLDGTPVSCSVTMVISDLQANPVCMSTALVTVSKCVKDCAGTINGSKKFDSCGVCAGDGLSCITCNQSDVSAAQFQLDGRAANQARLVRRVANSIVRNAKSSPHQRSQAVKAANDAEALYLANWQTVWSVPSKISSCSSSVLCSEVNFESSYTSYIGNSEKLLKLLEQNIAALKKIAGKLNRAATDQLKKGTALHGANVTDIGKLPTKQSHCVAQQNT